MVTFFQGQSAAVVHPDQVWTQPRLTHMDKKNVCDSIFIDNLFSIIELVCLENVNVRWSHVMPHILRK